MNTNYYFDEAGFTGSDLNNVDQPYFCLGSSKFSDDEILQIKKDLSLNEAEEFHFKKLYKSANGQNRILTLLSHPLINKQHIKFGIAFKRYCVYAQMVDVLIETMANSLGENIYANRTSLIMANILYTFAVHHPKQDMIEDFEKAFVTMIRKQDTQSVRDFYEKTYHLQNSPDTSKEFMEMLGLVMASRLTVADSFTSDKFYLDITLTLFISLVFAWYRHDRKRMNIKFDNSKPIDAREKFIRKLMRKDGHAITVGPQEMEHQYPLPIDQLELVDSKDYLGVQIADLIASSVNFILTNDTPKYAQFREKLKSIPVLQQTDVTLTPSSAEYLRKAMDTPYDESPIDTLASFIYS